MIFKGFLNIFLAFLQKTPFIFKIEFCKHPFTLIKADKPFLDVIDYATWNTVIAQS